MKIEMNLCDILQVSELEEFKLRRSGDGGTNIFRIYNNVLQFNLTSGVWLESNMFLRELMNAELIKLPFIPKDYEEYWTVMTPPAGDIIVKISVFTNAVVDMLRLEQGLVFRTREEAETIGVPRVIELGEKWGAKLVYSR